MHRQSKNFTFSHTLVGKNPSTNELVPFSQSSTNNMSLCDKRMFELQQALLMEVYDANLRTGCLVRK